MNHFRKFRYNLFLFHCLYPLGINYFLDVSSTLILLLLRLKSKKKRVRMHSVSESIHTLFSVTAKS